MKCGVMTEWAPPPSSGVALQLCQHGQATHLPTPFPQPADSHASHKGWERVRGGNSYRMCLTLVSCFPCSYLVGLYIIISNSSTKIF